MEVEVEVVEVEQEEEEEEEVDEEEEGAGVEEEAMSDEAASIRDEVRERGSEEMWVGLAVGYAMDAFASFFIVDEDEEDGMATGEGKEGPALSLDICAKSAAARLSESPCPVSVFTWRLAFVDLFLRRTHGGTLYFSMHVGNDTVASKLALFIMSW